MWDIYTGYSVPIQFEWELNFWWKQTHRRNKNPMHLIQAQTQQQQYQTKHKTQNIFYLYICVVSWINSIPMLVSYGFAEACFHHWRIDINSSRWIVAKNNDFERIQLDRRHIFICYLEINLLMSQTLNKSNVDQDSTMLRTKKWITHKNTNINVIFLIRIQKNKNEGKK